MEDVEVSESPPPVEAEPHAGDDECGSGAVAPDDSAPREGGDAAGADRDAELDGASVDAPGVAGSQAEPSSVVLSISSDDASGSAPMEGGGGGARADGGLEAAASPDAHRRHSPPSVHASAADDDVSGDEWGESPPAEGDGVFGSGQLINMSAMSRQAAGVDGGDGGKKSLLSRVKKGLSDRRRRSGTPTSSPASSPASGKHPAATIPDSGPDRGDASDAGEGGSTAPVGGAPHAEADAGAQSAGNVVGGAGGVADGEAGAAVPAAGVSKEELQRRRAAVKEEKKKEAALAKRTREWLDVILCSWPKLRESKRTRLAAWAGIPPAIRGRAWTTMLGNAMRITPDLYAINARHGRSLRAAAIAADAAEAQRSEAATDSSGGDGDAGAGGDPGTPASPKVLGREGSIRLISQDLPRTFPDLAFFHGDGPLAQPLQEILEAYVCYRPDVGYVQGMSFLAATFLLYMDAYSAFLCFCNLLHQHVYFDFFRLDMPRMRCHMAAFDALFAAHLPALHAHFTELAVEPELYLLDWLMTLFAKSLPLDVASRVWDTYFLDGELFIFRTALGLLRMHRESFLAGGFGEVLGILKRLPPDMDADELFEHVARITVKRKVFDRLVEAVERGDDAAAKAIAAAAATSAGQRAKAALKGVLGRRTSAKS